MASPRLPFLYPSLQRIACSCKSNTCRSVRVSAHHSTSGQKTSFHSSRQRHQETYHRRYGPAVEPRMPPPARPKEMAVKPPNTASSSGKTNQDGDTQPERTSPKSDSESARPKTAADADAKATDNPAEYTAQHDAKPAENDAEDVSHSNEDRQEMRPKPDKNNDPLQKVLYMPPSSGDVDVPSLDTSAAGSRKPPPHLSPPPYVHHFDTYSLVRDLSKGGFTDDQSVTIMKAVRNILQNNLDLARDSLTSKSDVENESYLFKAACSELQSSIQMARNAEVQRQRSSRTHLQHEADILSQKLNQELAGLKDDIKGMFNDHKMATREMQRSIDTSVQELNYQITVSLTSDSRSEIEGLRWVLTRRAAYAVAISAGMIIGFLKYYSFRMAQEAKVAKEAKEAAAAKEAAESRSREVSVPTDVLVHEMAVPGPSFSESLG